MSSTLLLWIFCLIAYSCSRMIKRDKYRRHDERNDCVFFFFLVFWLYLFHSYTSHSNNQVVCFGHKESQAVDATCTKLIHLSILLVPFLFFVSFRFFCRLFVSTAETFSETQAFEAPAMDWCSIQGAFPPHTQRSQDSLQDKVVIEDERGTERTWGTFPLKNPRLNLDLRLALQEHFYFLLQNTDVSAKLWRLPYWMLPFGQIRDHGMLLVGGTVV